MLPGIVITYTIIHKYAYGPASLATPLKGDCNPLTHAQHYKEYLTYVWQNGAIANLVGMGMNSGILLCDIVSSFRLE